MLTLDMAYTNARLLGRIEAHWLKFIRKDENASLVQMAPNPNKNPLELASDFVHTKNP